MNQNVHVNKTNFDMKGFTLGLALKQAKGNLEIAYCAHSCLCLKSMEFRICHNVYTCTVESLHVLMFSSCGSLPCRCSIGFVDVILQKFKSVFVFSFKGSRGK